MGKTISDRILNKMTGRNMETVYISLEEMLRMLEEHYIQPASSHEQYQEIYKTVKGSWLFAKTLQSEDGNYELYVRRYVRVGIFNLKDHNYMWIHDKNADKYFEYRALFWGKVKKSIRSRLNGSK